MTPSRKTAGAPAQIPEEHAAELRTLAHDMSNALEIIVQTSYLLKSTDDDAQAAQWLTMLEDGLQKALKINEKLRNYLKTHTAS
jgi:hypothetical protein